MCTHLALLTRSWGCCCDFVRLTIIDVSIVDIVLLLYLPLRWYGNGFKMGRGAFIGGIWLDERSCEPGFACYRINFARSGIHAASAGDLQSVPSLTWVEHLTRSLIALGSLDISIRRNIRFCMGTTLRALNFKTRNKILTPDQVAFF